MDELRVLRREDQSLIVANEAGEEFRLVVDSSVLADLRHLARQANGGTRVNPREIQALVRAGKTRAEIMELTDAEESDIERYEEPVLAERRFLLSTAQSVPVRTSPTEQNEEQFGVVIAERLVGLIATDIKWSSWRDQEAGWMIGLTFDSHGTSHNAVWAFEHRKRLLSPLTQDAVTLSKQGEVGDRLIPKLRAVDSSDAQGRFDSDAFDRDALQGVDPEAAPDEDAGVRGGSQVEADGSSPTNPMSTATEAAVRAGHPSTASIPVISTEDEFTRRREIDQRAIKSPEPVKQDLGQTADLLDALRKRRGAREDSQQNSGVPASAESSAESEVSSPAPLRGIGEWQDEGDRAELVEEAPKEGAESITKDPSRSAQSEQSKRGKGRSSIPSWDDILFGTRSEDDSV